MKWKKQHKIPKHLPLNKKKKRKSIGLKKFPIWSAAVVYFPGLSEPFYWSLIKSNSVSCIYILFSSRINQLLLMARNPINGHESFLSTYTKMFIYEVINHLSYQSLNKELKLWVLFLFYLILYDVLPLFPLK